MPPRPSAWPERPIRLFRDPEPVEVTAPRCRKGRRASFRWRRASHRVAALGRARAHRAGMVARGRPAPRPATISASRTRRAAATGSTARAFMAPPAPCRAGSCMGSSHERHRHDRLCRVRHPVEFLLPARRLQARGAGGHRQAARPFRDRPCRPQHGGRRRARLAAGEGRQARLSSRLPPGLFRRHARHPGLSAGPHRAGAISAAC